MLWFWHWLWHSYKCGNLPMIMAETVINLRLQQCLWQRQSQMWFLYSWLWQRQWWIKCHFHYFIRYSLDYIGYDEDWSDGSVLAIVLCCGCAWYSLMAFVGEMVIWWCQLWFTEAVTLSKTCSLCLVDLTSEVMRVEVIYNVDDGECNRECDGYFEGDD